MNELLYIVSIIINLDVDISLAQEINNYYLKLYYYSKIILSKVYHGINYTAKEFKICCKCCKYYHDIIHNFVK